MNREQKSAVIAEIADQIRESDAVYAVDFRGISVPQAAELRSKLRDSGATFRVVKNTLTERAADDAGAAALKALLEGPTALTFVSGDAATAAKTLSEFSRQTDLLAFKGGILGAETLDVPQMQAIARLPSRDVLYGQLVGMVASPITGVVRGLNALIQGLALQLGQIAEKKASGEIPAGEAPAAPEPEAAAAAPEPAAAAAAPEPGAAEAAPEPAAAEAAPEPDAAEASPGAEAWADTSDTNDNEADASAQADDAEAKED